MLGHLRTGALDKFKETFDKALNRGEAFAPASRQCSVTYMDMFDEGAKGLLQLSVLY